jgi:hypothetical protein
MPAIDKLMKGARPDPPDKRDFRASFAAAPPTPIDWAKGSGLPRPQLIDQNEADCCVACAWSYYHWQLRGQQFSRRDLFARIALPAPQGAIIRDGGLAIVNQGQATEAELPDPPKETLLNMRDITGVTAPDELQWKEYNSFQVDNDIESVARAILLYRGVNGGIYGTNDGWNNLTVPEPPLPAQIADLDNQLQNGTVWGHSLYMVDFHMHQNDDGSQEQCIIAATSWPDSKVTEHHIRARYFAAGGTFNPWTLIPAAAVASMLQNVTLTTGETNVSGRRSRRRQSG